jgi:ABC-2 type transport system ATP-binding protein
MKIPIEIDSLSVSFRHGKQIHQALDQVSFRVEAGKTVGFIGPNGAGKTTALHVLLGFLSPDEGHARLFGEDTSSPASRSQIGYLSEHPECYKYMTGREYLEMTAKLFGIPKADRKQRIDRLLEDVELTQHANKRIATYSRGMLQRIGLAQAMINDPELLILDEPTNGLDPLGRMRIRGIIEELKKKGKTIFFSSHELSEIETVCDEIIMIANGRIIRQGAVNELIGDRKNLEHYFLDVLKDGENSI